MSFFERGKKKSTVRKRSLVSACALCHKLLLSKNKKDEDKENKDKDNNDKENNDTKSNDKNKQKQITLYSPISVSGEGRKEILLVCDHPTIEMEQKKNWFAIDSDVPSFIFTVLNNLDIETKKDCWMTGATLCLNCNSLLSLEYCLPNLDRTITTLKPKLIIPIGNFATYAVMSFLWRDESMGELFRFYGQQIPVKRWNAWVCPVYDSRYIMSLSYKNMPKHIPTGVGVVAYFWLERYIEAALQKLNDPPFPKNNSKDLIQFLYNNDEISDLLKQIGNFDKGYAVFDYETNCLKPEVTGSKVLCASICFGGWNKVCKVISFPMFNDVIPAWKNFLQSPIPKIAHNCKFEDRWSNVYFKTPVKNWAGDTMLNTHILNSQSGITSLKFQAAVNFGAIGYEDAVKPYMSSGIDKLNRLHEVPLEMLLHYCAQDSLYTWRLFVKQMRQFGQKPYWK